MNKRFQAFRIQRSAANKIKTEPMEENKEFDPQVEQEEEVLREEQESNADRQSAEDNENLVKE